MFYPYSSPYIMGEVVQWPDFGSAFLHDRRNISVWLPPGYHEDTGRRYPVLYLHDGQNVFDAATSFGGVEWNVDGVALRMIYEGQIEPLIMVGISNTPNRLREYNPLTDGGQYGRLIVEELMPAINDTFRTQVGRRNALMGSSMGGLIALAHQWWYPEHFFGAACLSPSLWVLLRRGGPSAWLGQHSLPPHDTRLYLDHGTVGYEGRMKWLVDDVINHAASRGWPKRNLKRFTARGGDHNEASWAARVHRPLDFLFGR